LAKYALQARAGRVDLEAAAAATAQRTAAVQAGLEWLAARGQVRITERDDDLWSLAPGMGQRAQRAAEIARSRLDALLAESAAYRAYVQQAPAQALVG
jgi:hypothetical protein